MALKFLFIFIIQVIKKIYGWQGIGGKLPVEIEPVLTAVRA
jgi:hypothetical protein